MESKTTLNQETLEKIQSLIQANIDSHDGFNKTAEAVTDSRLTALFNEIAEQRSRLATELQTVVQANGLPAEQQGSVAAKTHRVWIKIRGLLSGGDPHPLLVEAERGEDHIKAAYEEVLQETAGSAINDLLQSHYATVKSGHDKVRDLRDAFAAVA